MKFDYATERFTHSGGAICDLHYPVRHPRLRDVFSDFFARDWRPAEAPGVSRLENVVLAHREDAACLYDPQGRRIDVSAIRRATRDLQRFYYRAAPELPDIDVTEEIGEAVVYPSILIPHWGHFLLESIARLWAVQPGAPHEGCACVFVYPSGDLAPSGPYADFLAAAGIRLAPLRRRSGETRLARCFAPAPTFEIAGSAHPLHLAAPRRVARRLLADDRREDRPVYLSRSRLGEAGGRVLVNEREFEAELARRGVRVVHMERLSLAEQIGIVNAHRVFIGPIGSAWHNILFCLQGHEITTFSLLFGGPPRNYLLVDSLVGPRAHYLDVMRTFDDGEAMHLDIEATISYLRAHDVF